MIFVWYIQDFLLFIYKRGEILILFIKRQFEIVEIILNFAKNVSFVEVKLGCMVFMVIVVLNIKDKKYILEVEFFIFISVLVICNYQYYLFLYV